MEVDGLLSMASQAAMQMPYLKAMEIWSSGIGEGFFFRYEVGTSEVNFTVGATWNFDVAAWQTTRRQKSLSIDIGRKASREVVDNMSHLPFPTPPPPPPPGWPPGSSRRRSGPLRPRLGPAPGSPLPAPTAPAIFAAAAAARAAGDPAAAAVFLGDARERARRN
ncbi:hypothetical protein CSOJ01_15205 [Colletotrichum sojae]|uniref:DUF6546 domain-containing protein n=1 Tax=Colletotrichum sojae TaxID=2175907 RepID=A0A8H6MJ78_9PEZI|nr:hypothetical protein CSOJ01_15205 [Colletotrichum sojae]